MSNMTAIDKTRMKTEMKAKIGKKLGVSRWYEVTQELINQFSASTLDDDPMHLDVAWSRENTPFGGTIAAGFWTTSMLIPMSHDIGFIEAFGGGPDAFYALNYGCNRLRLITPVPVGRRIRGHMTLRDWRDKGGGKYLFVTDVEVEIEGEDKPALIAEWLAMVVVH
jgi:acyl dehydratase